MLELAMQSERGPVQMGTIAKSQALSRSGIPCDGDIKFVIYVGKTGEYYRPEMLLDPLRRLRERGKRSSSFCTTDSQKIIMFFA